MTLQEIFDKVSTHLLKQNQKSIVPNEKATNHFPGGCAYRGDNGLKCAVGCLIPDDKYHPKFEGISVAMMEHKVLSTSCQQLKDVLLDVVGRDQTTEKLSLLRELQHIHDTHPVENWPYALNNLSTTYFKKG